MARTSFVQRLPRAQGILVDATIREFRYFNLDGIVASLHENGIPCSRSAVARYVRKLEQRDCRFSRIPGDTLVVIVERSSGSTATMSTCLNKDELARLIEAHSAV